MRRTLALVALLATTWPHVMVMRCAEAPHTRHDDVASVVADHAHHGLECPAIMACSSAMIERTLEAQLAPPGTPPVLHSRTPTAAPTTADLTAEPPPPRRLA